MLSDLMIVVHFAIFFFAIERPISSFALKHGARIRIAVFIQKKKKESVDHDCRKVFRNMSKISFSETRN